MVPWGLVAGWGAVAVWLGVQSLGWPLIHDAPLMHYVAWRIGEGAVPYRDIFDMNFPGTYLVHLAVLRLLGPGDVAWRAFDLAWLGATSLAIAAFARPWGGIAAAGGALVFAVYHLAAGAWQAGQRDFLLSLFLVIGALGVVRWTEGAGGRGDLLGGGLALGAGATIKPHALVFAAVLGLLVVVVAWRSKPARLAPAVGFALATALMPAAVVTWLAAVGAVPAWREIVLGYVMPFYAQLGRPSSWTFYRWQTWIPLAAAVLASLALALGGHRFTVRHGVAALGVAYGLGHHFGQGKGWEYHLYPLAGFAAALAFSELRATWRHRRWLAFPLAAALALAVVMAAQKGVEAAEAGWIRDKARLVDQLTRDLDAVAPGERVQVLDTAEGGIHALLRLGAVQPTRFIYDFHFFHDAEAPAIQALRAQFLRDFDAASPRVVVVFERGWPFETERSLGSGRGWAGLDARGSVVPRLRGFPELARRLDEHYSIAHHRPGYVVYAKRRDP